MTWLSHEVNGNHFVSCAAALTSMFGLGFHGVCPRIAELVLSFRIAWVATTAKRGEGFAVFGSKRSCRGSRFGRSLGF